MDFAKLYADATNVFNKKRSFVLREALGELNILDFFQENNIEYTIDYVSYGNDSDDMYYITVPSADIKTE